MKDGCPLLRDETLKLTDDVEAVAEWEENGLYTGVVDYEVIEGDDALGLLVLRDGILPEFAVPKDIIGEDETAGLHKIEDQIVIGDIFTLVGIHVDYVVGAFKSGKGLAGIPDVQGDLVSHTGTRPPIPHQILQFVIDFQRVDVTLFRKSISHAGCGITGKSPDLKYARRP